MPQPSFREGGRDLVYSRVKNNAERVFSSSRNRKRIGFFMKVASPRSLVCRLILISAFASIWLVSIQALALTITSPPTLSKATNAPLAGNLQLATDVPSRVSVSVNDGTTIWTHDFLGYGANHSLILLGFKPNQTNEVTVTARDQYQNAVTADQPVIFVTDPVPSHFPKLVLWTDH